MTLRVDVLTSSRAIANYASTSVLGRASERGVWEVHLHDLRDAPTTCTAASMTALRRGSGNGVARRADPSHAR